MLLWMNVLLYLRDVAGVDATFKRHTCLADSVEACNEEGEPVMSGCGTYRNTPR